jgi:hypothetical protein
MENLKVSVTENEIEEMIKDADKNHNGYIPYNGKHFFQHIIIFFLDLDGNSIESKFLKSVTMHVKRHAE